MTASWSIRKNEHHPAHLNFGGVGAKKSMVKPSLENLPE